MKAMNKVHKKIKKIAYETRGIKPRTLICLMLAGGAAVSLLYSAKYVYSEYASSRAEVDLYYSEIADAQYPDGSRFTYYDFADTERVEKALKAVQERGIYQNFTPEDFRNSFYVYSYLDSSVSDAVDYARSEGSNYSYVANEYRVVFFQPHDYDNENFLQRFVAPDRSKEFLQALMDVNYRYFVEECGGSGGFKKLTDMGDLSQYDYSEKIGAYSVRIDSVIDTLNELNSHSDHFVSQLHGRSLKDIVGEYKLLKSNLQSISDFIESSGLTRDLQVTKNKLRTNMEISVLNFNKKSDLFNINKYAQDSYDHTFTENLIVVALDDEDGLYQARPKTAFDTVVNQKHDAMEETADYQSKINDINTKNAEYDAAAYSGEEYARLCRKCEDLQNNFAKEFEELSSRASEIVGEFYETENNGFMNYSVHERNLLNKDFFMEAMIMFIIGGICAFVLSVLFNSWREAARIKRKKKIIESLRKEG